MKTRIVMNELKRILHFICLVQFWRMAVLWTVSLLTSYWQLFFQRLFSQKSYCFTHHLPPTIGRRRPVCVITGATSGLGAAAAYALSKEGFIVVLAGRSTQLLSETMIGIMDRNKDAHVKAFQVDLSSFQSILKFRDSLQQWLLDSNMHFSIQLLINNAGILATSPRLSSEGYDQMMSTNYVGAFSLTKLLLPLLRNSPVPSRIVNVTSFTHRNVFGAQIDNESVTGKCFLGSKDYPFAAADPGVVKTNIMREVPSSISHVAFIVLKLFGLLQMPENGINSILDAALAPPETSGVYFCGGKGRTINSSAQSYNSRLAEQLWTISCRLYEENQLACKDLPN